MSIFCGRGQDLALLYGRDAGRITIVVDAPKVKVDIAHAVPGALIVNELVKNAVKHAFPDTGGGNDQYQNDPSQS